MLFKRLWSNHRGYALLWKSGLQLESDIILRSGIEAAICIAANYELREAFVAAMHGDAIFTVKGQIKLHRNEGNLDLVRESEAVLRHLQSHLPAGAKAERLNWQQLAEKGRVAHLYGWHRMLSGNSSHVTGSSILSAVIPVNGGIDPSTELLPLQKKMHFMMMAGATLEGSRKHAAILEDLAGLESALGLLDRLAHLSTKWPGALSLDG